MIKIENTEIEFQSMGFFTTDDKWIHPPACVDTFEIIYVTDGNVFIEEGGVKYELMKGDLLILTPHTQHKGYKESVGETSFYWLHFYLKGDYKKGEARIKKDYSNVSLFKELLHYTYISGSVQYVKDSILAHLICTAFEKNSSCENTLSADVYEWTRINSDATLTVKKVADHFGFNREYISRIIKKQYGITLKVLIDTFILSKVKNYLINSKLSVKEISNLLRFSSPNTFIKFYKYHQNMTPSEYRNTYFHTHMNKN